MPMGNGEKSKDKGMSSNTTADFLSNVRATEKKEQEHKTCGSYGKGKKK